MKWTGKLFSVWHSDFMCFLILISYFKVLVPLPVTIPQCRGLYDFDVEDENDKKDCLCFKKVKLLELFCICILTFRQSLSYVHVFTLCINREIIYIWFLVDSQHIYFLQDEILTVIKRVDSNWIEGKKGEKIGIFPISFVEVCCFYSLYLINILWFH